MSARARCVWPDTGVVSCLPCTAAGAAANTYPDVTAVGDVFTRADHLAFGSRTPQWVVHTPGGGATTVTYNGVALRASGFTYALVPSAHGDVVSTRRLT